MTEQSFDLTAGRTAAQSLFQLNGQDVRNVSRVLVDCDVDKQLTQVTVFYTAQPIRVRGDKGFHVEHRRPTDRVGNGLADWLKYNRETPVRPARSWESMTE